MPDIRHFMNLVEGNLFEAVNYNKMFNGLLVAMKGTPLEQRAIEDVADIKSFAAETLKRDDRVVWYLNLWKLAAFSQFYNTLKHDPNADLEPLKTALDREIEAYDIKATADTSINYWAANSLKFFSRLWEPLQHFLSLPIPGIQNYQFQWQQPDAVLADFARMEKKWKEARKRFIPHQDEQTVLSFPDGYQWELLDRGGCAAEGDAMGHCGNVPSARPGDRILSLRRIVEKDGQRFWEPFLTFILNKDGLLGEMKGRGNEKPAPRYHRYIIALLDLPLIKGILGGGYLPENNFSLDDLGEEAKQAIIARKPELGSPLDMFKAQGFTPVLSTRITAALSNMGRPCSGFSSDGSTMNAEMFNDWQGAIEEYGDRDARRFLNTLDDDNDHEPTGAAVQDAEHGVFARLPRSSKQKIGAYLAETYPTVVAEYEEDEGTEYDPNFSSDVWAVIARLDDDLLQTMIQAAETGISHGRSQQMERAIADAFTEYDFPYSDMQFHWNSPDGRFAWGTKVCVAVPTETVCEILSNPKQATGLEDDGWMVEKMTIHEPSYGYNDFDPKAAVEEFLSAYPQFAPDA